MSSPSPRRIRGLAPAVIVAVAIAMAGTARAQGQPAVLIAETVRAQGFQCTDPAKAQPDSAALRPDEPVWILECKEERYRVRLMGDMPAKIERLE